MQKLVRHDGESRERYGDRNTTVGAPSLVAVLWRRRLTLGLAVAVCLSVAALYLVFATRIYAANAKVLVEQNAPDTFGENHGALVPSESYVQTQADVLQSSPVLARALEAIHYRNLKTFAKAGTDPVTWLRHGSELKIDVAKKSDVILVSMESAYPQEAALIANAIVNAYVAELTSNTQSSGLEMLKSLEKEQSDLHKAREAVQSAMQKFKAENDVVSFGNDRGNTALDRTVVLSTSLTTAEMNSMELRADLGAINHALAEPASLSAFVEAQQFKAKDSGDHEYDDLRNQLIQQMLSLSTASALQGPSNARVQTLESVVNALRARIAEKERSIARAHLVSVSTQLAAAESNERQLREAMKAQRSEVIHLGPAAAEYAKLEGDAARIQRQLDRLETRMGEVHVSQFEAWPMNVQFLEQAHADIQPIKPNKSLVLLAAGMLGWVLGIGLALGHEWHDACFRTAGEIHTLLGTSVLGSVPRINARLSPVARGQILYLDAHSPSAEGYRAVRTSLHLGSYRDAKTILLTSPTPGDGKSTTASNLAIAFAQAGCRTLLIDCDMREPVQHLIFEKDGSIGVSSVVAGEAKLGKAIQSTGIGGLYLLPCGPVPANPSELLAGKRFGQLMRALLGTFDRIVIDSPPLMMVSDARVLAAAADATLLVLRMNQSMHRTAMLAMEGLERVGANVLGAIANDMPAVRGKAYYRGSWEYASSAKRVMASVAGALGDSVMSPAIITHRSTTVDLSIDEPDWSADTQAKDENFLKDDDSQIKKPAVSTGHMNGSRKW